jgi:hypothetical protein
MDCREKHSYPSKRRRKRCVPAGYDPRLEQNHRGVKGALVVGVALKIMTRRTASARVG